MSAAALVLSGCSFDERAFPAGGSSSPNPAASDSGGGGSTPSGPSPVDRDASASDSSADAATTPEPDASAAVPEAGEGTSGTGGTSAGGEGGGGGSDEPDASIDGGVHDTGAPGCEQPACVCAHTRLETPADPCAAPDCPLSECAPDDDCVLKRFASSVYYVCSIPHSQPDALAHCQAIPSMHLVYIGSAEENEFVHGNITGKVWIGAVENEEDVWTWMDGTPFYDDEPVEDAYVNWDESVLEPNGAGVGEGDVTCAILWSETAAWADTNCPAENGYVCELEL